MAKVIVIGGGPAGCTAAYTLARRGHDVELFEAADSLGGRTRQLRRDGFNLGTGALFLMGGIYPRTMALLKEMGHYRDLVPWTGVTELADNDDQRYRVRFDSLLSFFKLPVLSPEDRWRLVKTGLKLFFGGGAKNPFAGDELAAFDEGENLEQWSREALGDQNYEYVMRPIMDFLYAVPLSWLSTPFPKAIIQQAHKLALSVPPEGIGQVSDWFVERLPKEKIHLSCPVEGVERDGRGYRVKAGGENFAADGLVVATEAFVAAKILGELITQDTNARLMATPYTEYAHVAVAYEQNPWPDYPADMVLPVGIGETRDVGSLVLHGRRSPNSVPKGGEVVGVYFNTPPLAKMSDEDIKREAVSAVHQAFGEAPRPSFVHLFRYEKGLTIAKPGHYAMLDAVHGALPPGICLAGDYFSQAGVEAAVYSGERAALNVMKAL
ncbi:MAG: FAD-dependent oxidoreductase [Gammaproteobacteria bacterium]|nr:FAD-dependent oxidoreductase [Gammaproteobacteria bacterium]